jgi:hypothetical protein
MEADEDEEFVLVANYSGNFDGDDDEEDKYADTDTDEGGDEDDGEKTPTAEVVMHFSLQRVSGVSSAKAPRGAFSEPAALTSRWREVFDLFQQKIDAPDFLESGNECLNMLLGIEARYKASLIKAARILQMTERCKRQMGAKIRDRLRGHAHFGA